MGETTTETRTAAAPLAGLGAVLGLGAIAAGGCCVLPLAFAALGISGSWLGGLIALAPYRPYVVTAAGLVLVAAWIVAIRRRRACVTDAPSDCRETGPGRATYLALALATKLFLVGAAWPWIEPVLLSALVD